MIFILLVITYFFIGFILAGSSLNELDTLLYITYWPFIIGFKFITKILVKIVDSIINQKM